MAERKPYLLRLPNELMDELMRWAKDDLRSLNAQIEWVLRDALRRQRRKIVPDAGVSDSGPPGSETEIGTNSGLDAPSQPSELG